MIVCRGNTPPEGAPDVPFWRPLYACGLPFGNKCGHQRLAPRLTPAEPPPVAVPPVLVDHLGALDRIYFERDCLPELGPARSEIRETIVLLLKAAIPRMDLISQRVGYAPDLLGRMPGILLRRFVQLTGLTYSRVRRGIKRLVRCGLATRSRIWAEKEETDAAGKPLFGGRASTFHLANKIFQVMKCNLRLAAAAGRAYKEQVKRKAAAAAAAPAGAIGRNAVSEDLAKLAGRMSGQKYFGWAESGERIKRQRDEAGFNDQITAEGRRRVELHFKIHVDHPDWTPEQVSAEYDRQQKKT